MPTYNGESWLDRYRREALIDQERLDSLERLNESREPDCADSETAQADPISTA
ncbi:MAG TPA: hypothetical protein VIC30_11690 [Orrella sp.]